VRVNGLQGLVARTVALERRLAAGEWDEIDHVGEELDHMVRAYFLGRTLDLSLDPEEIDTLRQILSALHLMESSAIASRGALKDALVRITQGKRAVVAYGEE
jgi:hypothetical protein